MVNAKSPMRNRHRSVGNGQSPSDDREYVDVQQSERELLGEVRKLGRRVGELALDTLFLKRGFAVALREDGRRRRDQATPVATESKWRRLTERYVEIEERRSHLANLYVASSQLAGCHSRAEAYNAIQEIVRNLVGSEEIAVFEFAADRSTLSLVSWTGINPERYERISLGSSVVARVARTGRAYLPEHFDEVHCPTGESDITACIPLVGNGEVAGAFAVFRLLPQKEDLSPLDRELFDLVSVHGAAALARAGQSTPRQEAIAATTTCESEDTAS